MITDLEKVKLLIGEENYNLLLKNGYFPIFIDSFKEMVDSKYGNNQSKLSLSNVVKLKNNKRGAIERFYQKPKPKKW